MKPNMESSDGAVETLTELPKEPYLFQITIEIGEGISVDQFISQLATHDNEIARGLYKRLVQDIAHSESKGIDLKAALEKSRIMKCTKYAPGGSCGALCRECCWVGNNYPVCRCVNC